MINDKKLKELCSLYNIDEQIPYAYIKYLKSEGHFYFDIPCGKGKTMGLAIAAACCDDIAFNYCASTHSRLREFVDTLSRLNIPFHYLRSSSEVLQSSDEYLHLLNSRINILTSSMLIQFDYKYIQVYIDNERKASLRALVIDELPKILLPVMYDAASYSMFKSECKRFTRGNYWWYQKLFQNEDIYFSFDSALNESSPFKLDKQEKLFWARHSIIKSIIPKKPKEPINYEDNMENFKYDQIYLKISELYSNRSSTSIILDATADLYAEVLDSSPMVIESCEKDYHKFIDSVVYMHFSEGFGQRVIILDKFLEILREMLPSLMTYEGPYYLVTHNSAVYDGMGEEKVAQDDILQELNKMFKQVYINDNKDFILCRSTDDPIVLDDFGRAVTNDTDLFISNFARSRGSNYFRDCRTVWTLGSFFLPEPELESMLTENSYQTPAEELQINLAVADAVQEISRGCIRKRKENEKMNLIMMGDKRVILKVFNYLGIENATEM